MADLLDVNVWIALSAKDHSLHYRAVQYWRQSSEGDLVFCRHTALGFVRVVGGPHTRGGAALDPGEAWRVYTQWLSAPGVQFATEPQGIESVLSRWVSDGLITRRIWPDAYLAAFSILTGSRFVTFDRDFARFPGLKLLHLA
ncbi:MAG: PIN domain-containing protein [Fimbriimonadaceae bacterium]|nr:PIN domain-containing protein [Fimbriimonadaceae bacterium]